MGFCCYCLSNYCFVGYVNNYLNFCPLKHFRWACRGFSYPQVLLSYMTFKTDKPYPGNAPISYCFWVILGFQFLSSWGEDPSQSSGAKSHLLMLLTFNHKRTWAKLKPCSTQRLHWLRAKPFLSITAKGSSSTTISLLNSFEMLKVFSFKNVLNYRWTDRHKECHVFPQLPPTNFIDKTELSLLLTVVKENTASRELWWHLRTGRQDQSLVRIGSLD